MIYWYVVFATIVLGLWGVVVLIWLYKESNKRQKPKMCDIMDQAPREPSREELFGLVGDVHWIPFATATTEDEEIRTEKPKPKTHIEVTDGLDDTNKGPLRFACSQCKTTLTADPNIKIHYCYNCGRCNSIPFEIRQRLGLTLMPDGVGIAYKDKTKKTTKPLEITEHQLNLRLKKETLSKTEREDIKDQLVCIELMRGLRSEDPYGTYHLCRREGKIVVEGRRRGCGLVVFAEP